MALCGALRYLLSFISWDPPVVCTMGRVRYSLSLPWGRSNELVVCVACLCLMRCCRGAGGVAYTSNAMMDAWYRSHSGTVQKRLYFW